MNANDCFGFQTRGNFLQAAKDWKQQPNSGVTYLVVCNRQIPRLQGASDILYVGQTGKLGGENNRLWNYHYATSGNVTEYRVRECVKKLVSQGDAVFLYTCQTPPAGLTVMEYELSGYRTEHCESPPLNSAG